MKKKFFILAVTYIAAISVRGQKLSGSNTHTIISAGIDAGMPAGGESAYYSFVIGGSLQGEFAVAHDLGITVSAGFQSWTQKYGGGSGFVPLLAGIKYYFTPQVYGSGQLGATLPTEKDGRGAGLTYAPGIGFKISNHADILVKYTGMWFDDGSSFSGGHLNYFGLRIAYNF